MSCRKRSQALLQILHAKRGTPRERIQHYRAAAHRASHQKMRRERHALQRQSDPPSDLDIQNRQGNWNAELAVDDVVEIAVARIVDLPRCR